MSSPTSPNRATLIAVAHTLRPILDDIVFVGGQVGELLITDPAAIRIRPTYDVDVLVSACSRLEYHAVERRLTELGLSNDMSADILCRWLTPDGHQLDVMVQSEEVLGFSNRWYPLVLERATPHKLTEELGIMIPTPPLFLATNWEAFLNRGERDFLGSKDLEDIVTLVAGRPELPGELANEDRELRTWIADRAREFLDDPMHLYAIEGAVPDVGLIPELGQQIADRFSQMLQSAPD